MHLAYLGIRLGRKKAEQVVRALAFLYLPDRSPIDPEACEKGEGPTVVERKPNIAASGFVEFAERSEGHQTAVFDSEPAGPVLAFDVRMFVIPLSGSMRSSCLKSTLLPLA